MVLTHMLVLGLGGLLMASPVVLHLLMKPKPKPMLFPALRFVREMKRTSQTSLQLRHLLLLLARILLIGIVALAFARPSTTSAAFGNWLGFGAGGMLSLVCLGLVAWSLGWARPRNWPIATVAGAVLALAGWWSGMSGLAALDKGRGQVLTDRLAPVAAVVVIDSSPRMEYRFRNQTVLERARDEGAWIIEQLPPDSRVSIVQNDGQPPFFSVDAGAAQKRLKTVETRFDCVGMPETVATAIRLLSDEEIERKEIYILSDLTRGGWPAATESLQPLLEANESISVYLLDMGVEDPVNLSLDQLELSSTSVPENGEFSVKANLRAVGPGGTVVIRMKVEQTDLSRPVRRDGETLLPEKHWERSIPVTVADNAVAPVSLTMKEQLDSGIHHGWIELESGDSLAVDNRLWFTIEVRPSWKVLVVHPDNVDPGNLTDALSASDSGDAGIYAITTVTQQEMAQQYLDDFSAVYLLDPAPLSDASWQILHRYVESGGGLGIFLGRNAGQGAFPDGSFQTESAAAVLPGTLERQWRGGSGQDAATILIAMDDLSHAIVAPFRPYATLGIWQPFDIYRHWEMTASPDPTIQPVVRYTNGIPAVLERTIGNGRVICMTTPITDSAQVRGSWNDLFNSARGEVWPAWLLTVSIAEYLASGARDQLNLIAGQTASLENDRDAMPLEYRLFSPRDEEPARVLANDNSVRYRFTDVPGNYRLRGQLDGPVNRGFSVNLPPGATDLERVSEDEIASLFGDEQVQIARERTELERQQGTVRLGQEFYPVLALALALVLGIELVMSNRFYKS